MPVAPAFDQPNTWDQMLAAMRERMANNDERVGQAAFNALDQAWPDLAELVRGTQADPFHAESVHDPRYGMFIAFILPYFVDTRSQST